MVDSSPYSSLVALQRMGVVADYTQIRNKTIVVVKFGGVSSFFVILGRRSGLLYLLLYLKIFQIAAVFGSLGLSLSDSDWHGLFIFFL